VIATTWPDVTSYTDYSALSGRSYRYRVRAYNTGGYSAYSNIASLVTSGPPTAPKNLAATTLTRSAIGLTWTNTTADQTELRIERCQGSGCTNFVQIASLAGTATSFTNSGLLARTTYRYRVRAHNALGDSSYSNTASARTKG